LIRKTLVETLRAELLSDRHKLLEDDEEAHAAGIPFMSSDDIELKLWTWRCGHEVTGPSLFELYERCPVCQESSGSEMSDRYESPATEQ
jgi:hypothetical protein